jgi:DNA topoisomerase-3
MIYQRQLDIENFKKEKYYQFQFNLNHNDISFKAEPIDNLKFKSKEELYSYLSENHLTTETNRLIVKNIQDSEKKVSSPKLHSLSSLQTRMNNLLGSSPKNTLEATEKLYLAKFLSYPRTNTHYITNKEFDYLRENIESYKNFLNVDSDNIYIEPRKRYCDSSKVGSHYAIILSKKIPTKDEFEAFSELEKAIYLEIAKTVVAMFLDDYIYKETTIDFSCQDLNFRTKGATPKKLGWKKLFNNMESSKEIILPDLQVTDEVSGEFELLDKVTRPPKLFTEGSLITAMKTASKTLDEEEAKEILDEVEGIGTEATRADIIETLKDNDYIVVVKKNIIVTAKGKALCQALKHQPLLSSVEMTAKWESYLKKIGEREERATQDIFLENVKKFILHLIDTVDKDVSSADLESYKIFLDEKAKKDKLADCPMCDGSLLKKKTFIGCSNYPDCEFSLPLKFRNKSLTETNILDLVNGKETTVKGIKSQQDEKKKYNAIIKLADEGLKFVGFANSKQKKGR